MHRSLLQPRRLAALALVLMAASLAACSRDDKVVNPPVTGAPTWDNTVQHLIADRSEGTAPTGCTSCHHEGTTIPDWTQYANVFGARSTIRSYIDTPFGPMRQFLKPGEPEIIIGWIDAGAPEH